ncbi:hypothetical protein BT63DRAFT_449146 [Microthyrium microscopicum]|uniref:Uncharacterized protein n=1 Tax=Microthyrium microscopicum TaxID=703497 RepID=A0A6A6UPD7_9PEZI|nr:hypothetical protein BT63DRAFT_449146 [Microthyrium microscopicum]
MFNQKRVVAKSIDVEFETGYWEEPPEWEIVEDFHSPWSIMPVGLEISTRSWTSQFQHGKTFYQPLSSNDIRACDLQSAFVKGFVQRARIPRHFRYVAPGLCIVTAEELADQPFKKVDLNEIRFPFDKGTYSYRFYPFLFLRADVELLRAEVKWGNNYRPYHGYPWQRCSSY